MNLVSCDRCGVVLDRDKLNFPKDIYSNDGSIDTDKACWVDGDFLPYIKCPVCNQEIW